MAMAMTFVLSAGEIDLSVGAIAGLSSVTAGMALANYGIPAGVVVGIGTGLAVGVLNGTLSAIVGIPSFLVTLGMMGIARGSGMWISGTAPVPIVNDTYNWWFGSGSVGPVPVLVLWVVVLGTLFHITLKYTPFGRRVLATGGNRFPRDTTVSKPAT